MLRIQPNDLAVFVAVARHRSFRKAADELGVTPSALSHTLRALEEKLDVRLLNRSTRSVAPTEAGQRLLARISPAFRDIDDALDDSTTSMTLEAPRPEICASMPREPRPKSSCSRW
jgi:DNA-binding transcriptional LysR family regulator